MLNVALNNDYDGDFQFSCPIWHTQSQSIDKVVCSHKANDKDMCWPPRIVHPNGVYFTKTKQTQVNNERATFNEGTGFGSLVKEKENSKKMGLENCCLNPKPVPPSLTSTKQTICLPCLEVDPRHLFALLLHHLFGHPSSKSFNCNLLFRRCCKYDLSNRFLNLNISAVPT